MKNFLRSFLVILAITLPQFAIAFDNYSFKSIVLSFVDLINLAIPVVIALTVLIFFWGLVKFIYHMGGDGDGETGKELMIWGIIALFVMFSLWGIVNIIAPLIGGDAAMPKAPETFTI
jgi:hypothetical protein